MPASQTARGAETRYLEPLARWLRDGDTPADRLLRATRRERALGAPGDRAHATC